MVVEVLVPSIVHNLRSGTALLSFFGFFRDIVILKVRGSRFRS